MRPLAFRCTSSGDTCDSCDRSFNRGDIVVCIRSKSDVRTYYCRSCLNDVENAVDQLFRSEDRGVKEVKP